MSDLLVIDLDLIRADFEDIKLFDIIYFIVTTEEKDGWIFSTTDNLEYDLSNDFNLDEGDEGHIAVLDFETNELSKIDVKVTVEQVVVEKTKIDIRKS